MRNNSALWMAAIAVGGLLIAGLVGTMAMVAFKSAGGQKAIRPTPDIAEVEKQLAATQPTGSIKTQPTQPGPPPPAGQSAGELWRQAQVSETAQQIFSGYQGNTIAADLKYKGKLIATTGIVQKVDVDLRGNGVVVFSVGETIGDIEIPFGFIHCTVDNADKDRLATLAPGHAVALVGYGGGKKATAITLEKCRILHAAENEQTLLKWFNSQK